MRIRIRIGGKCEILVIGDEEVPVSKASWRQYEESTDKSVFVYPSA